ncbi:uncharacterized protein LOC127418816 [Myxocyprinus asiaticus]|uniref:uncharacterized protein LOC127418816 n=1 Tax=Myxocyprinus asiaticus TaxID=70543 RepID=UPI002222E222|nr:uncharacterized protein LOC127418816 [Myxocyprinus asiaticus]
MRTYCVLLHIFVVLLLCDYGMFSTSSSSSSEDYITSSNIWKITSTTAESTKVRYYPTGTITELTTENLTEDSNLKSTMNTSNYSSAEGSSTTATNKLIYPPAHSTGRPESPMPKVVENTQNSETSKDSPNTGKYLGVIILVFTVILIILLLGILYFLRKKGRSYSFDLTHASCPANEYDTPLRSVEQGVNYEHTNKECLDYIQEDKSEEKASLMANGCAGEKTEQTPASENEQQNAPEENSFTLSPSLTPPMKKVEFNLDLDLISIESELNSPTTVDGSDAPQNENNSNVSNAGRGTSEELFTEINLDEPKEQA